jgi:hypothetical protein
MTNSSYLIYSILTNLDSIYKKKPELDFKKLVHKVRFLNAKPYKVNVCKKLYNSVENNHISHGDIMLTYLYESLFSDKPIDIKLLNVENIKSVRKLFTYNQYCKDRFLIKDVIKELKLKGIVDIFEIRNGGENIVYKLIKNKHISPIFYIQNYKKVLPRCQENNILKSKDFKHFEIIINIIFNKNKEMFYA